MQRNQSHDDDAWADADDAADRYARSVTTGGNAFVASAADGGVAHPPMANASNDVSATTSSSAGPVIVPLGTSASSVPAATSPSDQTVGPDQEQSQQQSQQSQPSGAAVTVPLHPPPPFMSKLPALIDSDGDDAPDGSMEDLMTKGSEDEKKDNFNESENLPPTNDVEGDAAETADASPAASNSPLHATTSEDMSNAEVTAAEENDTAEEMNSPIGSKISEDSEEERRPLTAAAADGERESSMRDIDLSPPSTPMASSLDIDSGGMVGARRRTGSGSYSDLATDPATNLTKPDAAPIRFGNFINKQIIRARRLFRRPRGETDGIAGTVKIDPATGNLLPVQQSVGATGGPNANAVITHASDLRRRKSRIQQYCERTEYGRSILRSTLTVMHFLARLLLWSSIIAMVVMIVYYSHELKQNGTDPHLIAWFSAGAFVLLGFPISIYGIFAHLSNYYQPHIQCYVVRILWMVPIYSIESWLCLRFHTYAIYIETLRDCYESFVLYSFFQFLIQVLGGEEELIMMLKDKSPTRGVHIWGFDLCIRPWLMGQPVSRTYVVAQSDHSGDPNTASSTGQATPQKPGGPPRTVKQVRWTSPFLVKCKRGILQYVVLKFVCSVSAMLLEVLGWYHEGSFSPRHGYFYICFLTNFSQCWALYCLVFFYYATKNELGPIRPVGKFLSVKALVFFTWWQSVGITILFQMGMIPHYSFGDEGSNLDWTAEDVAKGLQDYLICIEMFGAAILHMFVFPHTDYLQPIGIVNSTSVQPYQNDPRGVPKSGRRIGRKGKVFWNGAVYSLHRDDRSVCSKSSSLAPDQFDLELGPVPPASAFATSALVDTDTRHTDDGPSQDGGAIAARRSSTGAQIDEDARSGEFSVHSGVLSAPASDNGSLAYSQHSQPTQPKGFVHAFLDSTLPKDVLDESVGYLKGNYNVEKKTLLSHAATSDEYDLFSKSSKRRKAPISGGLRRAGDTNRRSHANKTLFPQSMYPGVPVMKSVKEQD